MKMKNTNNNNNTNTHSHQRDNNNNRKDKNIIIQMKKMIIKEEYKNKIIIKKQIRKIKKLEIKTFP